MSLLMNDESHIDRYVRITNRERYLIVRALSVLKDAYYTMGIAYDEPECLTPGIKDVITLSRVFCEENWMKECTIRHANKVVSVETMEQDDE
jgi:hypothetical protein